MDYHDEMYWFIIMEYVKSCREIVIYGVGNLELRRKIENFLDDNYRIVGYSDSYYQKDIIDNHIFIDPKQLMYERFDYIVLAISNLNTCEEVILHLMEYGISSEKVIIPYTLILENHKYQKNLLHHIDKNLTSDVKHFIFGLSYSLRGIDKERLCEKCFDFSWHGLDLYYNYRLLCYAIQKKYITYVHKAILVFPYYYFNYDMSMYRYQYDTGQILSVVGLNDFHRKEDKLELKKYIVNMKMFGKKFLEYYNYKENIYIKNVTTDKIQLNKVWGGVYIDTIRENEEIFDKFLKKLYSVAEHVVVIVPPFYLEGINGNLDLQKNIYYDIMNKHGLEIVDVINKWRTKELFSDATHLNYDGAICFTDFINREILG